MIMPTIAQKAPFEIEVKAGKRYFWCSCGQSKKQPFCDGSHKDTGFSPIKYDSNSDGRIYFCGCKQSAAKPLCDGSHKRL